jgi:hypothetical protein
MIVHGVVGRGQGLAGRWFRDPGNGGGAMYVARAMGDAGTWAPFVVFATGLGDTESVGIEP